MPAWENSMIRIRQRFHKPVRITKPFTETDEASSSGRQALLRFWLQSRPISVRLFLSLRFSLRLLRFQTLSGFITPRYS